jgi:hypothetical protein
MYLETATVFIPYTKSQGQRGGLKRKGKGEKANT